MMAMFMNYWTAALFKRLCSDNVWAVLFPYPTTYREVQPMATRSTFLPGNNHGMYFRHYTRSKPVTEGSGSVSFFFVRDSEGGNADEFSWPRSDKKTGHNGFLVRRVSRDMVQRRQSLFIWVCGRRARLRPSLCASLTPAKNCLIKPTAGRLHAFNDI